MNTSWVQLKQYGSPILFGIALLAGTAGIAPAAIEGNVSKTKHNLSASGTGTVKASSESQICVFCHTPHGANTQVAAPLWNRNLSVQTYTPYTSSSMDAITSQPGGNSKLCLSCHDGTMAIGTVGVLDGVSPATIAMTGTATGDVMPADSGVDSGFTRNLGIDLSNDHPISFTYDTALASNDGELRSPPVNDGAVPVVANRVAGVIPKPLFPLEANQMECTTCHDPHIWESDPNKGNLKFLRGNRLQQMQPIGAGFDKNNDNVCLACHDKGGTLWAYSAHANQSVADETYLDAAALLRDFPINTPVWKAACLNCHDTHTVQGAKRLLREGTDSLATPKRGGNSAAEQACYQCHSALGQSIIIPLVNVPDIKSDFTLPIKMPVAAQPEQHDIGGSFDDSVQGGVYARCNTAGSKCGKDFMESQAVLGKVSAGGSSANRHAECSDCHNPHRVTRNRLFNDNPVIPGVSGTHKHTVEVGDTAPHNNLASGSLRGTFGVEPSYFSAEFGSDPSNFAVKRGDGGTAALTDVISTYVTREYQVCLKCHSNYAYDVPPSLGYGGGTVTGTNGLLYYTNTAMEFQAPLAHKGAPAMTTDSGAAANYSANNHRSWHPVMDNTGRTTALRGMLSQNLWRSPFNGSNTDGATATPIVTAVGQQTMYCSDCHGSANNQVDGAMPLNGEDGNSWGPHGSSKSFLLKGDWNTAAAHTIGSDTLCFRCHDQSQYADPSAIAPATTLSSGFGGLGNDIYGQPISNLHQRHAYYTANVAGTWRCTSCHTGGAHGWKNKAFLVNLNDLGPEINAVGGETTSGGVTLTANQPVPKGTSAPTSLPSGYSNGPYYRGAYLRVNGFKASGNWVKADCTGCHTP